jgi:quercetin dioxygenase-like cupin family protein
MDMIRADSRQPGAGPADWFTGDVTIDMLNTPPPPARVQIARVTFQPGARTAWHRHPLGQTLVIEMGTALIGREDGSVVTAEPGDVVWFSPGERHWHGATAGAAMTHAAIQESGEDGKATSWEEHVPDDVYATPPGD